MGRSKFRCYLLLVLVLLCYGCTMARYSIKSDGLKYATSLSPVLKDSRGKNLYIHEDLVPLGGFEFSRHGGMGGTVDISAELNREVEKLKGEGIVNLCFRVSNTLGGQSIIVTGTVVSRKASRAGGEKGL